MYKFTNRIQDENKGREEKLMAMLTTYGEKLAAISAALERLAGDVESIKKG